MPVPEPESSGFATLLQKTKRRARSRSVQKLLSSRDPRFRQLELGLVLLLGKMWRLLHREGILLHHSQMHTAGVFLVGIGIAAVVALFAASKQSDGLRDDVVIAHSSRDEDQPQ